MKKSRFVKILLSSILVISWIVLLSSGAFATETVKISYSYADSVYSELVEANTAFDLFTPTVSEGDIFYGWVDAKGTLYPKDTQATASESTTLYLVSGKEVSNESELLEAVAQGKTYIKLARSFAVNASLSFGKGIFVIDTNGQTLTINTEDSAFLGTDTGFVFTGDGKINHTTAKGEVGLLRNGFISLSPIYSLDNLVVDVANGTSITTDTSFIIVTENISRTSGALKVEVYGSVKCEKLMLTNGISGATFSVYSGATVTTDAEFFFEDTAAANVDQYVSLHAYGGTFYLNKLNGIAKDSSKYQFAITSALFSEDISSIFVDKNYKFKLVAQTGLYALDSCAHTGPVISGFTDNCETATVLKHKCTYCNTEYTKNYPNGVGHTNVTSVEQPLITTEEKTQAAIYKHYCQKCGQSEIEKVFPNPQEVYVTVIVLDLKGREEKIRVPSKELFSFHSTEKTKIVSFSTEYIQAAPYNITQDRIISVEIPLGTTVIYGELPANSEEGTGAFTKNQHLREVVLPESIVDIQSYSFRKMPKLTHVKGLQYVTGTIGEYAFEQDHTNVLIDQMAVNAKTIGRYAFYNFRMNSLFIGKDVSSIGAGAFGLDPLGGEPVKEVLIEGYTSTSPSPLSVSYVLQNLVRKTYNSTSQQFGSRAIVYTGHQLELHESSRTANCYQTGFDLYKCRYCSYQKIENEKPMLRHSFEFTHVAPTCLTQGYEVDKCKYCGDEKEETKIVREKKDPNAHDFSYAMTPLFIDMTTHATYENGSVCKDYYCMIRKCKCGELNRDDVQNAHIIEPAGSHTLDESKLVITKAPNCGDYGSAYIICSACSQKETRVLSPTNAIHKWDSGTITKAPTCTEVGEQVFKCTVCTSTKGTRVVTLKIDKENHKWDDGYVQTEATETTTGVKVFTCVRCSEITSEGINKLDASGMPVWLIILFCAGGALLFAGVVLTLYFTLFKKKRASASYAYKFNTFK